MGSETSDYPSASFRLSDLPLRAREWFLVHRFQLRKWWVLLILLADTLLFGHIIVALLIFFVQSPAIERGFVSRAQSLGLPQAVREVAPQSVTISQENVLRVNEEQVDFLARVENPNVGWVATLRSVFTDGTQSTEVQETRIAPGQTRYVFRLAETWSGSTDSSRLQLRIESLTWQRLANPDRVGNISFTVSDIAYVPDLAVPNTGQRFARVTAQVRNDSLYGFWTVRVPVILLQNKVPVALTSVLLRSFASGDTKTIEAQWFRNLPSDVEIIVLPEVDIFDEQNYMNLL